MARQIHQSTLLNIRDLSNVFHPALIIRWQNAQNYGSGPPLDSLSKITKKQFYRTLHREDKIFETYTSRGGSEVDDILLNSTAQPPFTLL